jgi:hypothetical protein
MNSSTFCASSMNTEKLQVISYLEHDGYCIPSHAKHGDIFIFFMPANGKAQANTQSLFFFIFPWFPLRSICVPQHILHSISLLCHMLWQMLTFHLCLGGPKGRNSILQNRTFYFGEPTWFFF